MDERIGKRIKCIQMFNDPNPISSGSEGEVIHVGGGVINVKWDDGRGLGLVEGVDIYVML